MRRLALWAALLALVLVPAGCGDSSSGPATSGESARTAGAATQPPPQVIVETAERGFDAVEVFREAAPGVVTIRSVFDSGAAEGSGFVLDEEGRIVTNAHVVTDESGSDRKPAEEVFVEFPDRNVVPARPNGFELHPLELGDDRDLVVGQPVAAIGSPFGEQQSLSVGVVSATGRSVESLTRFQIDGAIQTDASINPGNSGGPLLDAGARVIGINQQIQTSSGANDGVGFAVPVSAIKRSIVQLERDGEADYAYIGVSTQPLYPQLARKLGLETEYGGLLDEIVPDGPADEAGLQGSDGRLRFQAGAYRTGGDVILAIEGHRVVGPNDLARYISTYKPGETVTLEVLRDGRRIEVEVTLGKRPRA